MSQRAWDTSCARTAMLYGRRLAVGRPKSILNVASAQYGGMTFGKHGLPQFVDMEHRGPRWNPIRSCHEPVPQSFAPPLACRCFDVQKTADARDELFFRERYGQHRTGSLGLDTAAGDGVTCTDEIEHGKTRPQMLQVGAQIEIGPPPASPGRSPPGRSAVDAPETAPGPHRGFSRKRPRIPGPRTFPDHFGEGN